MQPYYNNFVEDLKTDTIPEFIQTQGYATSHRRTITIDKKNQSLLSTKRKYKFNVTVKSRSSP